MPFHYGHSRTKRMPRAGTKGAKSKTRPGDLDFTTKRGDKDFHRRGHDVKLARSPFFKRGLAHSLHNVYDPHRH